MLPNRNTIFTINITAQLLLLTELKNLFVMFQNKNKEDRVVTLFISTSKCGNELFVRTCDQFSNVSLVPKLKTIFSRDARLKSKELQLLL